MKHRILIAALLVGALGAGGCSTLQSPTPKSNAIFNRYAAVERGNGLQRMEPSDEIALPEQWATGAVRVHIDEQYNSSSGVELLKSRILVFERNSDAGPAAELAAQRSADTVNLVAGVSAAVGSAVSTGIAAALTSSVAKTEANRDVAIVREQQQTERAKLESALHEGGEEASPAEGPSEPPGTAPTAPSNPTDPAAPSGS